MASLCFICTPQNIHLANVCGYVYMSVWRTTMLASLIYTHNIFTHKDDQSVACNCVSTLFHSFLQCHSALRTVGFKLKYTKATVDNVLNHIHNIHNIIIYIIS